MAQTFFAIGDVHGKYQLLKTLLTNWQPDQQLVFTGDLIDRGEDSRSCLALVYQLAQTQGAICLMGNHEWMFLNYLADPQERYGHYQRNGGDTTINSLLGRPLDHWVEPLADARLIEETYGEWLSWLRALPYHYETDHYIFVHAGLDLSLDDPLQTEDYDKIWLRQPFHQGENKTGKTIVFGHTPTDKLFASPVKTAELWRTADSKLGIDGGAAYGGLLHGVVLDQYGPVKVYSLGEADLR